MFSSIICSACGGLAANLVGLMEIARLPRPLRPNMRDPFFWLPFFIWPVLGAGLGYLYVSSGIDLKPILALNVGASAPLIIKSMIVTPKNPINPGQGA